MLPNLAVTDNSELTVHYIENLSKFHMISPKSSENNQIWLKINSEHELRDAIQLPNANIYFTDTLEDMYIVSNNFYIHTTHIGVK